MSIVTGVVEAWNDKFDKYSIKVNGQFYSTKLEWSKCKPVTGESVEFDDAGGKYTKNLRIVSGGSAPSVTPGTPQPARNGFRQAGTSGGFPLAADAYERALDRRNALTAAVSMLTGTDSGADVNKIIDLAREFEAYTTGSSDQKDAEELLATTGGSPKEGW